jgi:hypothetical protein
MKPERVIILLFLGAMIAAMAVAVLYVPVSVRAQCDPASDPNCQPPTQDPCIDPQTGANICNQATHPPSNNKPKATKVPTRVHTKTTTPTLTETPTDTPTSTPTVTFTPIASNTATPTATALPPTATAIPTSTPVPFCIFCGRTSPLLLGGGGVLLFLGFVGILTLIFRGPLGLGPSGVPGGTDPFPGGNENGTVTLPSETGTIMPPYDGMGNLGSENATVTRPDSSDLGGGMESATIGGRDFGGGKESFTISVHDGSDISPDGALNAREAASDPGLGAKPPNPNLGDKSGGGTL